MRRYLTFLNRLAMSFALCLLLAPELLLAQGRTYVPVAGTTGLTSSSTAITSSLPFLLPDGSSAAPALAFASLPAFGLYMPSTGVLDVVNSVANIRISGGSIVARGDGNFSFSNSGTAAGTPDTRLYRDAANTLALRNGTNAQTFNIYNTYTDASNYERGGLNWAVLANFLSIGTDHAGTGLQRGLALRTGGGTRWGVTGAAGDFYPFTNDGMNVGAGDKQIKELFLARSTQGSKSKAIADNVATAFVQIAIPQTAGANYADGEISFTIFCRDASNQAVQRGSLEFACHNIAGAEACTFAPSGTVAGAIQGDGTASLGSAVFTAAGGADAVVFSVQSNCTGVTPTTQTIQYRLNMMQPNTVTPQ